MLLKWIFLGALLMASPLYAFNHKHPLLTQVIRDNIVHEGPQTFLDYNRLRSRSKAKLTKYLSEISVVSLEEYNKWDDNQKIAFLINAYNAYTIKLIISAGILPGSIKDLGVSVFGVLISSPWRKKIYRLLGQEMSLGDIEHQYLRKNFNEPRIHFALNCASISCPSLHPEAFRAKNLEAQLKTRTYTFLFNRAKNQFFHKEKVLKISEVFSLFDDDFEKKYGSVQKFLSQFYGLSSAHKRQLQEGKYKVEYLDYDWSLNHKTRTK